MKHFVIREDHLQGLVNYLASKPYGEVAPIIEVLQKIPEMRPMEKSPESAPGAGDLAS